jgi:hypothetical protein
LIGAGVTMSSRRIARLDAKITKWVECFKPQ